MLLLYSRKNAASTVIILEFFYCFYVIDMITLTYNRTVIVITVWAGRKTQVHRTAGNYPAILLQRGEFVTDKILSVFVDESGDFGDYDFHSPYYYVAMVFHDQSIDISKNIQNLEIHIKNLGFHSHAIHTGPLIRRESYYKNDLMETRKSLFNALFHFTRKLDIRYICPMIDKSECKGQGEIALTGKLSKVISDTLKRNYSYMSQFDSIIVYYDNGQVELTKILSSVFNSIFSNIEFRRVQPVEYKLFQVADLVCTMELLSVKAAANSFSNSETEFFGSPRDFRKNLYKHLSKKKL